MDSFLLTKDYSKLDLLLYDQNLVLLFSQELIDEFITVATRPKFKKFFSLSDLEFLLSSLGTKAEFVDVSSNINLCRDHKDNFLLALAKDGKASHILTGDKDLLVLKKMGRIKIITINEYISSR